MLSNSNLRTFLVAMVVSVMAILGIFYWWLGIKVNNDAAQEVNLVIEGVRPISIYNHTGDNAYIVNDLSAAVISVLEYYGANLSQSNLKKINGRFWDDSNPSALHQLEDVKLLTEELGYSATIEVAESIADFKKYFSGIPTPVIFSHFIEIDQNPEIQFKPMGVLIGMLDSEQSVIIHDYYFGYNKKLSYWQFARLGAYPAQVLVIKPKIPRVGAPDASEEYVRTESMDKAEPIINKITLGRVAQAQQKYRIAASYYSAALKHPDRDIVPPYYKVVALNGGVGSYIRLDGDYDSAYELAKLGEEFNQNLDEPYGDYWPGFVDGTNLITDQFAGIYYWLGRIYEHKGDVAQAKANYEHALEIYPYGPSIDALERIKTESE
ncbi:tetratricopeptide repeat protein [Candidatus Kaiserbacteria bacterium]|nr:tetratricopeptide repeat protein [Candidatus Kaiserbacteria bacterium]